MNSTMENFRITKNDTFQEHRNNGRLYWDTDATMTSSVSDPWVPHEETIFCENLAAREEPTNYEMENFCPTCRQSVHRQHLTSTSNHHNEKTIRKEGYHNPVVQTHSKGIWTQFAQHLIRFCETTSLRGVPRIVKTRDKKRRLLWGSFVAAFFFGCITCIYFIISQYNQLDVIHQPKTVYDVNVPFPSITVCNLRPFSSRANIELKKAKILPMDDYFRKLKDVLVKIQATHDNVTDTSVKKNVYNKFFQSQIYMQNLSPNINLETLGHSQNELILHCNLVYRSGSTLSGKTCHNGGTWSRTQNDIYHNCYTYTVDDELLNSTRGLTLSVYLNNQVDTDCYTCRDKGYIFTQLTGMRLQLHGTSTYPNVVNKGVNLMPGTLTEIQLKTNEWHMMEPPHGNCSWDHPPTVQFQNKTYSYTQEACRYQVQQDLLAKTCDCVEYIYPIPAHLSSYVEQSKYCIKFRFSPKSNEPVQHYSVNYTDSIFKPANCSIQISSRLDFKYQSDMLKRCPTPCLYYTYDTSISSAIWPTKSVQRKIYLKYVNDQIKFKKLFSKPIPKRIPKNRVDQIKLYLKVLEQIIPRMSEYSQVDNLTKLGKKKEAIELLKNLDFMEKNFLSIQVSRSDFDATKFEEKAVISLTSLLSQVGGILSIWIGLTFVCIVEIIELLLNIVETIMGKNPMLRR